MGQTIWESRPDYRRLFGVPASDRIRNEARIPTLATGNIATTDDVNTILAAGRADLCELDGLHSP
jgi:anthraniloyl-CoA monooxygenase